MPADNACNFLSIPAFSASTIRLFDYRKHLPIHCIPGSLNSVALGKQPLMSSVRSAIAVNGRCNGITGCRSSSTKRALTNDCRGEETLLAWLDRTADLLLGSFAGLQNW